MRQKYEGQGLTWLFRFLWASGAIVTACFIGGIGWFIWYLFNWIFK